AVDPAGLIGSLEQHGNTHRGGPPARSSEARPPGDGLWGEAQFRTSLMVHFEPSGAPPESQTRNARYLSNSAVLPPGGYEIVINSNSSSRTLTVDTATIVTTQL